MYNKKLKNAIDKNEHRDYLRYIAYNKQESCYIATNGHILLLEKTSDSYPCDKYFDPATGETVDDVNYPDWTRLFDFEKKEVFEKTFETFVSKEKRKHACNKFVKINKFYNYKLISIVFDFIGTDFFIFDGEEGKPTEVISKDGLRKALIMPYKVDFMNDIEKSEDFDASKPVSLKRAREKYIYISFDENNNITGVFEKITYAKKKGVTFKEYPIL